MLTVGFLNLISADIRLKEKFLENKKYRINQIGHAMVDGAFYILLSAVSIESRMLWREYRIISNYAELAIYQHYKNLSTGQYEIVTPLSVYKGLVFCVENYPVLFSVATSNRFQSQCSVSAL